MKKMLQHADVNQTRRHWEEIERDNLNSRSLAGPPTTMKHTFEQDYREDKELN